MTAALRLLDRGAHIALLDKEKVLGGNSAKASSGINGCCPPHSRTGPSTTFLIWQASSGINGCCPPHSRTAANAKDSVLAFANDTARSALRRADSELISVMAPRLNHFDDMMSE